MWQGWVVGRKWVGGAGGSGWGRSGWARSVGVGGAGVVGGVGVGGEKKNTRLESLVH